MKDLNGYAVYFFPQALEALGDAARPYLHDGKAGPHILCREIDTGGALVEMTLDGHTAQGQAVDIELMVPTSMVRMVVSARGDEAFGFGPRIAPVEGEGASAVAADAATTSPLGVAAANAMAGDAGATDAEVGSEDAGSVGGDGRAPPASPAGDAVAGLPAAGPAPASPTGEMPASGD